MGKRIENNFKKRFGDPPRITVNFEQKHLDSTEREYRNKRICEAFVAVMTSVLGRKPTRKELLGEVLITEASIKKSKRKSPDGK